MVAPQEEVTAMAFAAQLQGLERTQQLEQQLVVSAAAVAGVLGVCGRKQQGRAVYSSRAAQQVDGA